jgi:hypothetical protein
MKFQVAQNDQNNRGEDEQQKLKSTIISIWLGIRDLNFFWNIAILTANAQIQYLFKALLYSTIKVS